MFGDYMYILSYGRDGKDGILSFAESRIPHRAAAAATHVSKTQVQTCKDKPLTKYRSYVYEYGRSCCLSGPLSIAETAAAEIFSSLCAGVWTEKYEQTFLVVISLLLPDNKWRFVDSYFVLFEMRLCRI